MRERLILVSVSAILVFDIASLVAHSYRPDSTNTDAVVRLVESPTPTYSTPSPDPVALGFLFLDSQESQVVKTSSAPSATSRPIHTNTPTYSPAPIPSLSRSSRVVSVYSVWDRLAHCESSGNWQDNTGNGFYGGLQFSLSSWRSVGGTGLPSDHSREEQIAKAKLLLKAQGPHAWPVCSRGLNLYASS